MNKGDVKKEKEIFKKRKKDKKKVSDAWREIERE